MREPHPNGLLALEFIRQSSFFFPWFHFHLHKEALAWDIMAVIFVRTSKDLGLDLGTKAYSTHGPYAFLPRIRVSLLEPSLGSRLF